MKDAKHSSMTYIEVCHRADCKKFSRLVMGTDHLGELGENNSLDTKKALAFEMLDLAVEYGINAFDTAPIYVGSIERILGEWMKAKRTADPNIVLYTITKGGFPFDKRNGNYNSRLKETKEDIIKNISGELEDSVPNSNNQIDVYLMHRDDVDYKDFKSIGSPQTPVETILAALSDQQIRNSYTWIGISNWETERVNKAIQASDEDKHLLQPVITSPYFSLFEMDAENCTIHSGGVQVTHEQMMKEEFQPGIKIMPYSALGGFNIVERGWEKAKEHAWQLHERNDEYWGNVWEAIFDEKNEQRYHRAQEVLKKLNDLSHGQNYTLDQLLHAYVLAHPRVDLLAVGPLKPEHLSRTVQSLSLADRLKNYPAILDYLYNGTNKQDAFRNLDTEFI